MYRVIAARSLKFSEQREGKDGKLQPGEVEVKKRSEMFRGDGVEGGGSTANLGKQVTRAEKLGMPITVSDVIEQEARKRKKDFQGFWSPLGQPYVSHDKPDLELVAIPAPLQNYFGRAKSRGLLRSAGGSLLPAAAYGLSGASPPGTASAKSSSSGGITSRRSSTTVAGMVAASPEAGEADPAKATQPAASASTSSSSGGGAAASPSEPGKAPIGAIAVSSSKPARQKPKRASKASAPPPAAAKKEAAATATAAAAAAYVSHGDAEGGGSGGGGRGRSAHHVLQDTFSLFQTTRDELTAINMEAVKLSGGVMVPASQSSSVSGGKMVSFADDNLSSLACGDRIMARIHNFYNPKPKRSTEKQRVVKKEPNHLDESRESHLARWRTTFVSAGRQVEAELGKAVAMRDHERQLVYSDPQLLTNAIQIVTMERANHLQVDETPDPEVSRILRSKNLSVWRKAELLKQTPYQMVQPSSAHARLTRVKSEPGFAPSGALLPSGSVDSLRSAAALQADEDEAVDGDDISAALQRSLTFLTHSDTGAGAEGQEGSKETGDPMMATSALDSFKTGMPEPPEQLSTAELIAGLRKMRRVGPGAPASLTAILKGESPVGRSMTRGASTASLRGSSHTKSSVNLRGKMTSSHSVPALHLGPSSPKQPAEQLQQSHSITVPAVRPTSTGRFGVPEMTVSLAMRPGESRQERQRRVAQKLPLPQSFSFLSEPDRHRIRHTIRQSASQGELLPAELSGMDGGMTTGEPGTEDLNLEYDFDDDPDQDPDYGHLIREARASGQQRALAELLTAAARKRAPGSRGDGAMTADSRGSRSQGVSAGSMRPTSRNVF